jgi:hypothetical protein
MSRRSNLDQALQLHRIVADDPYWVNAPHDFSLRDNTDWHRLCHALMQRRFYCGENLSRVLHDLNLEGSLAHYMGNRLIEVASEAQIKKHLTKSATTNQYALKPLRKSAARLRASLIGRAMCTLALRDESIVRRVVANCARAANIDHQIEMMSMAQHAPVGQAYVKFVRSLGVSDLNIRLVGYIVADGARTDKLAWLDALQLSEGDTLFRSQQARNTQFNSQALHAGIEVVRTVPSGTLQDGACAHAMLMGAIVEMWRLAAPYGAGRIKH